MPAPIELIQLTRSPRDVRRFLGMASGIYRGDRHWVAPLLTDLEKVFSDKNPLFEHAEMQLWVARRNGRDVGRVAGVIDRNYVKFHEEQTAFFGFFECIEDQGVCTELLGAVLQWAKERGMTRLLGPMNPTTNDECGLLVEGFDSDPVFMMPYNPPYYARLIEGAGYVKAKDLLAFDFDVANGPKERLARFTEKFRKREPAVTLVPLKKKTLAAQIAKVKTVYNQAWEKNWGFVPMTEAEIDFMAERMKPLLTDGLAFVAETPDGPLGFMLAMPDFNEAFKPMRGRMLSKGLFSALPYFFRWKTPKIVRCITLGVTPKARGRGIEAVMIAESLFTSLRLGFQRCEASWILEDNTAVQRVISMFGGEPYKTYRLYIRDI
jgi:GNAT superfamily N-acetyltransferase